MLLKELFLHLLPLGPLRTSAIAHTSHARNVWVFVFLFLVHLAGNVFVPLSARLLPSLGQLLQVPTADLALIALSHQLCYQPLRQAQRVTRPAVHCASRTLNWFHC